MAASVINTTGHSVTTPGGGGSKTAAYSGTSKSSSSHSATLNGKPVSGGANGVEYRGNLSSGSSAKTVKSNVEYGFNPPTSYLTNGYNNGYLSYKDIADYVFSRSVQNARDVANYDYKRYKENQRHNDELYYSARDYYTDLANTAVQRRVKDLIAAGINPVLAGHYAADTPIVNPYYSSTYPTMHYVDYNQGVVSAMNYMNTLLDYEVGMRNAATNERYYDTDFQSDLARRKNMLVGLAEGLADIILSALGFDSTRNIGNYSYNGGSR